MPSIKWCVEPVFLSKKAIPPDKSRINEQECNVNNTLVGVLRQLASLVNISEKIFGDLNEDCRLLCERTINLKLKVNRCQQIVNQLNAKSVRVPVANLNSFIQIEKHYKSDQELTNNLFKLETRPQCVRDGYLSAGLTPLHIIESIDSYRDDGRCGSKLFICQPVLSNSRKRENFDIETRRPASLVLAHELPRNVLIERAKTPLCKSHHVIINKGLLQQQKQVEDGQLVHYSSVSILNEDYSLNNDSFNNTNNDSDSQQNPLYGLISPEERMQFISQEYPSKYVPIDVTGTAFNRMSNLRRSLIHTDFLIKRKKSTASKGRHNTSRVKRRNTICQSANVLSPNGSKTRVRRRSAGSIDFVHTSCQTEFNENEIYSSGRIVDVKKCKNKALVGDYNNNNQNSNGNNENNSCDNSYNKRENKIKLKAEVHHYESRSLDNLIDSGVSHQRRNQSIGSDMTELCDSNNKTVDETNEETNDVSDKCKTNQISNLTSVKMRDSLTAKGVGSDGRSSSGNWSASSSTHASESVDFDQILSNGQSLKTDLPHTLSNSSLGKDSVLSDTNTMQTTQTESEGRVSAPLNRHSSDISNKGLESKDKSIVNNVVKRATENTIKVQYANRDSESWLQYYDSSDTITPTPTESECGGQTTRPQTTVSCSGSSRRSSFSALGKHGLADDEAESVYSVDNDGYYTSMHTDSGLFRLPIKLMITPNSSFRVKGKRDSIASNCTVGDISINSILSKTETESSTTTLTNNSSMSSSGRPKMPPPPPPPRVSSMLRSIRHSIISNKTNDSISDNGTTTASNTSTSSRSHSPSPATITSESEHSDFASQQKTLKAKTVIDSSRYPSLCAITSTENSDDCRSNSSDSGSNRMTPTRKMLKSRSGSYIGFRIKDIFGFGDRIKEERSSPLTVMPTAPHIATIRRPQSPLRFNMYNGGEGSQRVRQFIDKFNASAQNNTYQTPNIVRANAISSFASDSNECSDNETKISSYSSSSAIKTAINEKTTDVQKSDISENIKPKTSRPVPNPRLSTCGLNSRKVPQNNVYPTPRQVSIPIPKPLDRIPSKPQNPIEIQTVVSQKVTTRPTTPSNSGQTRSGRSGARVTLDAEGCVIYASNSLGRRRDGHPKNYLNQLDKSTDKTEEEIKSATLPKATKSRVSSPMAPTQKSGALVHIQANGNIGNISGQNNCSKMLSNQIKEQSSNVVSSGKSNGQNNEITTSMSANSHPVVNACSNTTISSTTPVRSRCVTPAIKQQHSQNRRPTTPVMNNAFKTRNSYERTPNKALEVSINNSPEEQLKSSKDIKRVMESDLNNFVPISTSSPLISQQINQKSVQRPPESQLSVPVEEKTDQNSKTDSNSSTLRRGRLTTEDLLIIIHNSKKKHNIKTEPEIIIANSPPSSRSHSSNSSSNSPPNFSTNVQPVIQQSCSRPNTPSRTPQQTTDRRSWNGNETSSPNVTTPGNRRSLASDRLGPTKPTTMNDFKRLLSQTRSNTFNNERLSAAEILRANSKRPLTPVIKCITSFVGSGSKSNTSRVTPAPTPTPYKQTMRASPAPSPAPPPQIINGAINSNTPNLIKPRIVSSRSFRHPPAYRVDNICQPILEDSSEETDDKKCVNLINNQMINTITNNNRYYTQKFINKTPVINNYNKAVANPQSTSTWV